MRNLTLTWSYVKPRDSPSSSSLRTLSGKESKSVFDFFTYSREPWFSFSYGKVFEIDVPIKASNEIDMVSKFDNSLLLGVQQIINNKYFLCYDFLKIYLQKIQIELLSIYYNSK